MVLPPRGVTQGIQSLGFPLRRGRQASCLGSWWLQGLFVFHDCSYSVRQFVQLPSPFVGPSIISVLPLALVKNVWVQVEGL
jgi:hypothetical protein